MSARGIAITTDDFDNLLVEEIDNASTAELLSIPGVYELLAEHYNNVVLDAWQEKQEETDEEEEED